MALTIIAKNVTSGPPVDVTLNDLGAKVIPLSGQLDLGARFPPEEIYLSEDLKTAINAGFIVMNNGFGDLSMANSLLFVSMENKYSSSLLDDSAIHDNESNEIFNIAEKINPTFNDWALIEDSEASNGKKKVKVGKLVGASGVTNTVFLSMGGLNSTFGNYLTKSISSSGNGNFTFEIPNNFVSLVSITLSCIAVSSVVNGNIDFFSHYALSGEVYNTHSQTSTTGLYNLTADIINQINITNLFSALTAGDFCGVLIDHNVIGSTLHYLGIKLVYLT